MEVDPVEFTKNSAEILRVSSQLKELRSAREELNKKISDLEKELTPFLVKQAEMTAALVGTAMPVPAPVAVAVAPTVPGPGGTPVPASTGGSSALKQRILEFLRKCDEAVSAGDVAEALHIDPAIVREAMLELRNAR